MKSVFIIAVALALGCGAAIAQYMPTTEGKVFTYKTSVPDKKVEATSTSKVLSVQSDANGVTNVRIEDKEQVPGEMFSMEVTSYSAYSYNPADKVTTYTMMSAEDFKASIVDMLVQSAAAAGQNPTADDLAELNKAMKVRGELVMPLPEKPEMGAAFEKSVLRCTMGTQNMTITISKGLYKGFEEIETPAGKFNCLKVEYATKHAMGGPVENTVSTSWFAEGVGIVRTVSTDKKGNIKEEVVLEKISE